MIFFSGLIETTHLVNRNRNGKGVIGNEIRGVKRNMQRGKRNSLLSRKTFLFPTLARFRVKNVLFE